MIDVCRAAYRRFRSRHGNQSCVVVISPWHSKFGAGSRTNNMSIYHPGINKFFRLDAGNTLTSGIDLMKLVGYPRAHNLKLSFRVIGRDADDWPSDLDAWCHDEKTLKRIKTYPNLHTAFTAAGDDDADAGHDDDEDDAEEGYADDADHNGGDEGGELAVKKKEGDYDVNDVNRKRTTTATTQKSKNSKDSDGSAPSFAKEKYFAYLEHKASVKAARASELKALTDPAEAGEEVDTDNAAVATGTKPSKSGKQKKPTLARPMQRGEDSVRQLLDEMSYVENVHALMKQQHMKRILRVIQSSM